MLERWFPIARLAATRRGTRRIDNARKMVSDSPFSRDPKGSASFGLRIKEPQTSLLGPYFDFSSMTKLCVPITANTVGRMIADIRAAKSARADMVELRLDYLRNHDHDDRSIRKLMLAAKEFTGEIIATCRRAQEGGKYAGEECDRIALMEKIAAAGADYLDFEYEAWRRSAGAQKRIGQACQGKKGQGQTRPKLILSKHDFEKTPADLGKIFDTLASEPCHVVKLVAKAERITDVLTMLDTLHNSAAKRRKTTFSIRKEPAIKPAIALSMGETGILTRVLAKKFGALLTFASLSAGKESAPGQLTIDETQTLYRWEKLNPQTRVYGVIGCPVAHSMSPAILNAAFDATEFDGVYLPMRVEPGDEDFKAFIDGCISRPWLGLGGCSVTIPHKQNLLRYVEQRGGEIEPLTQRIGAANTLVVEPGQRKDGSDTKVSAYNTDYRGAMDALCAGMGISDNDLSVAAVAVLGAGGVSRAIVAGLCDFGCKVTIYNRTAEKAKRLAEEFGANAQPWEDRAKLEADVIINCTSIGMWPKIDDTPLPDVKLPAQTVVFDTIYNPIETRLLRDARACGCQTIDGVAMFVNQAAAQFKLWTDKEAPVEIMRDVVVKRLSRPTG